MKLKTKKILIVIGMVFVFTAGAVSAAIYFNFMVRIDSENAALVYKYEELNIEQNLTQEESKILKNIFNNKLLYSGSPSCGFEEDISIKFGSQTFCPACDTCGTVKLLNKGTYFSISQRERNEIEKIFLKYGAAFPCV